MHRHCVNNPDMFCYICGEVVASKNKRRLTASIQEAYRLYFKCPVGDKDKYWAPKVSCPRCRTGLWRWMNGKAESMPFGVPMVWREQSNHTDDCYFCMVPPVSSLMHLQKGFKYPNIPSALRPVPHGPGIPVPVAPAREAPDGDAADQGTSREFFPATDSPREPELFTQGELNDLVRDLQLSKAKAELLASRLRQKNLLDDGTRISTYRTRHQGYVEHFSVEGDFVACNDVSGLMHALGIEYVPSGWWLFIDSSKTSLKAVLLDVHNVLPAVPVAHAAHLKETYETMKLLLQSIRYEQHAWQICSDLKVIALLLGLQSGYTKYCCPLCLWDSREKTSHYAQRNWPLREVFEPGSKSVLHRPLVQSRNVLLPPLHVKLGLMRNFVKALDKDQAGFAYLRDTFPGLSKAKLVEGVFIGPQIRQLINDDLFESALVGQEKTAWMCFKQVVKNFLGKHRAPNFQRIVDECLEAFRALGCNMSLKVHLLHSHVDAFPRNCGAVTDEHGERFHQVIRPIEVRYQGKWSPAMLADYCWTMKKDVPERMHTRQAKYKKQNE